MGWRRWKRPSPLSNERQIRNCRLYPTAGTDFNTFTDAIRTHAVDSVRRNFDARRPTDLRLVPHTPAHAARRGACVAENLGLCRTAQAVLGAYLRAVVSNVWPSAQDLATATGVSVDRIQQVRRQLRQSGLLEGDPARGGRVTGHRLGRTARYRPAGWVLDVLRPYSDTTINPVVGPSIKPVAHPETNPVVSDRGIEERSSTVDEHTDRGTTPSQTQVTCLSPAHAHTPNVAPVVAVLAETWTRIMEAEPFRPPSPSDTRELQHIVRVLGLDMAVACMSVYVERFRQNFDMSSSDRVYDPAYIQLRGRFRGFITEINQLHRQVRQSHAARAVH